MTTASNETTIKTRRHPMTWVPTLYLAQGLPFYAVALVSSLMYKSLGVPNDQIAYWTGIIGLAWVFKSLWSPFLEAARSKKYLIVFFQLLGGASLGLVALALQLPLYFAISIGLLGLVGIAAATHDIAADGLYISSLSNTDQARYAGWQGAFFNAGKFLSLGGFVVLAGYLEKHLPATQAWGIIFAILGLMMLCLGAYHSWALPSLSTAHEKTSMRNVFVTLQDVLYTFFTKPGIWWAILFIMLFRLGEGQIQTIGPLFLREAKELGGLGLTTEQVGIVYGTTGTFAFLGGSILGGYFAAWLGLKRALPWLIIAMNLPNLVFYFLGTTHPSDLSIITAALSLEMFGYGFGFVGLILFMMQVVAVGKYQTAHYALATGIMQLGLIIPKMLSGTVQLKLGYENFFIWVLISAIPVFILCFFMKIKGKDESSANVPNGAVEA